MDDIEKVKVTKGGIKSPSFNSSRTNGAAHRRNSAEKRRHHLSNAKVRAELYTRFQGEKGWKAGTADCNEWHSTLKSLSSGTA